MEKNIVNIRKQFKEQGIYYTSSELAERLKGYVDYEPTSVYDPTCGQGNLLSVFPADLPKFGQELDPEELEKAKRRLRNFTGYTGDTLKDDGFGDMRFDCIVANPPFSIKWEPNASDPRFTQAGVVPSAGKADYAFILHILYHLADFGKAVILEFPGILYRQAREGKIREWLVKQNYVERVVHVPGNSFVDTTISTCILVLSKCKDTMDIIFEDLDAGESRTVPVEEVEGNGYCLSVNLYVAKEMEKEEVDGMALLDQTRRAIVDNLDRQLAVDKTICEFEGGLSQAPLLGKLYEVLEKYKETTA